MRGHQEAAVNPDTRAIDVAAAFLHCSGSLIVRNPAHLFEDFHGLLHE